MNGYTAKVGLRKSRLHFDAIRMRQIVRRVLDNDDRWLTDALEKMRRESAIPPHEHEWADIHGVIGCGICRIAKDPHPCPDMACPHCPCTYTAECCHCGDGQVHK